MAVLAECPKCRWRQATKKKVCKSCGAKLDNYKKSGKVRYWISFRLPDGKQRTELVGNSLDDAKAADGKRKVQKKENRFFDMLPESNMTWQELADWYLGLPAVKRLKTLDRTERCIRRFLEVYGNSLVRDFKVEHLEKYQAKRAEDGLKPSSIHQEKIWVGAMVRKADDNEKIDPRIVKVFRRADRIFKTGSNARSRVLSVEEYQSLLSKAPEHLKGILTVAYNTGMRPEELYGLQWRHIDREQGFIRLSAEATKEGRPKSIPINHHVEKVLSALPRHLHHGYVFTYLGKPIQTRIRRSLRSVCDKVGIVYGRDVEGGFVFKDIRTAVKTHMAEAGVDEAYRNTILGHSMQGMDKYYMKPTEDSLKKAMEKYTSWLDGEIERISANVYQNVYQAPISVKALPDVSALTP